MKVRPIKLLLTMALLSMTALLLQVVLSRLLTGLVYNMFYYFPLGMAFLGLCGGAIHHFTTAEGTEEELIEQLPRYLLRSIVASVVFIVLVFAITEVGQAWARGEILGRGDRATDLDIHERFASTRIPLMAAYGLACILPFYFLGMTITAIFQVYPKKANKIYFFDLFGAMAGSLLAIPLLNHFPVTNCLMVAPLTLSVSYVLWRIKGLYLLALIMVVFGALQWTEMPKLEPTTQRAYYHISRSQELAATRWTAATYFQLVKGQDNRWKVLQDHNSSVSGYNVPDRKSKLPRWIEVARAIKGTPDSTLIVAAGVGVQMYDAYNAGFRDIAGVEFNPYLTDFVNQAIPEARTSQFLDSGRVNYVSDEARRFLRRSNRQYDLIYMPPFGHAMISLSISPLTLFTQEAIEEYCKILSDDGLLLIRQPTLWRASTSNKAPVIRSRFLAMLEAGAKAAGFENPSEHILTSGERQSSTRFIPGKFIIVSKKPISDEMIDRLNAHGETVMTLEQARERLPPPDVSLTDDLPFWNGATSYAEQWEILLSLFGSDEAESYQVISTYSVLITIVLAIAVIFVPLMLRRRTRGVIRGSDTLGLAYFFFLGVGFMFIEIPLMQQFVVALGNPVHSISFCLAVLLVSAGIGSLVSTGFLNPTGQLDRARLSAILVLIIVVQIVAYFNLSHLINYSLSFSEGLQRLVLALAILPMGLLLGIPFPTGLRLLGTTNRAGLIPWAWGINGAASVATINLTTILARIEGISCMFLFAAVCYGGALISLQFWLWRASAGGSNSGDAVSAVAGWRPDADG